jgi:hypothetical protein
MCREDLKTLASILAGNLVGDLIALLLFCPDILVGFFS